MKFNIKPLGSENNERKEVQYVTLFLTIGNNMNYLYPLQWLLTNVSRSNGFSKFVGTKSNFKY